MTLPSDQVRPEDEGGDGPPSRRVRPWMWFGLAAASTLLPFFLNWGVIGVADFDQFAAFTQIALWWHELGDPLVTWDPFLCGGATLVGNPQVPLFHPNLPIYWLFGPVNGLGLSFLPWMGAGFWGMWKLSLEYGLRRGPAAWIATAWTVNGFFIGQLGSMHVLYSAFYLLPVFFLLNRAIAQRGDLRALAAIPFVLVLPSLSNHHFLAYGFPFVVAHFVLEAWTQRREPGLMKKVGLYGVGLVLAVAMLSIFLIPNFAWNHQFPRVKPGEFEPPLSLIQMLFFPVPIVSYEFSTDQFERYYTLGPVLFVLFVLGMGRRIFLRPQLRALVVLGAVAFLTAVGSLAPFDLPPVMPFDLLKRFVPGYQAIRVPSRFFINAIPAILLITGLAWQEIVDEGRWSKSRQRWVLGIALIPLILFNFGYFQFSLFSEERGLDREQPAQEAGEFQWASSGYTFQMMRVLEPNVGVLDCYEALEVPEAEALVPEHGFVLDAEPAADIERLNWGEIMVRSEAPARVRFNFNHHGDWYVVETDGAAEIVSELFEPLELVLTEGSFARIQYRVSVWPLSIKITLAAFALALLFAAGCLVASSRRRSRQV